MSQSGDLDINKFYSDAVDPLRDKIEANMDKDIAVEVLPLLNNMTCIVVDLKCATNEMIKLGESYISELNSIERTFLNETDEIVKKYGT